MVLVGDVKKDFLNVEGVEMGWDGDCLHFLLV